MATGASVRNQICAAVLARVEGITTGNGFVSNIGTNNPRIWRKADFQFGDAPEVTINDPDETISQGPPMGVWTCELFFEIWIGVGENVANSTNDSLDVTQYLKDIFADLTTAIGTTTDGQQGRFWSVNGTRLALDTTPGKNQIIVDQDEYIVALGCYRFSVKYRINAFSPNTVATY